MAARYRKVPTEEDSSQEESKKQRAERIEKISTKFHALFWVIAAIFLVIFTDLHDVAFSEEINR